MPNIDTHREAAIADHYDIISSIDKLEEECSELLEAISHIGDRGVTRDMAHLIEECVDVGIIIRRIEYFVDLNPQFKGLFQKMWEFKTIRQEIRIDIDDETFGGRHQEV